MGCLKPSGDAQRGHRPSCPARPAGAVPVRHPPSSCPSGASPRLLTSAGLAASLAPRASPPPRRAPGSEEGPAEPGQGIGAHDQRNDFFLICRGTLIPEWRGRYPEFSRGLIFKLLNLSPLGKCTGRCVVAAPPGWKYPRRVRRVSAAAASRGPGSPAARLQRTWRL